VVDHAVAERRGRNQTPLAVVQAKVGVCAGLIGLRAQFILQARQFGFCIELEIKDLFFIALAAPRGAIRGIEVTEIADVRIKVVVGFHFKKFFRLGGKHRPPDPPSENRKSAIRIQNQNQGVTTRQPENRCRCNGRLGCT
jgi:hypothetical protein